MTDENPEMDLGAWRWAILAAVVLVFGIGVSGWPSGRQAEARRALQTSLEHYQAGRYQDAVDAAKEALAAKPDFPDAYNNLAVSYLQLRRLDEAHQAAREALRLRPDYQLAKNNLAWIEREQAQAAGAGGPAVSPGASSADPPADARRALQRSLEHYQAGRYEEAVAAANEALAAQRDFPDAYNNLAVSYLQLRRFDEARQAARDALRLRPDYQLAKNNLAWIEREQAKTPRPAGPAASPAGASALLAESLRHAQAGRFNDCLATAAEAAKLAPDSAQAFNNLGYCAWRLQQWDVAIRNLQEAIRLDPGLQVARNNLAAVQQQRAALERAPVK